MNKATKVTISEVARAAGVAKSTASLALAGKQRVSPATREAVLAAVRRLGFEPNPHARRLANGKSEDTICLLTFGLDLGVATLKVELLQELLFARGWHAPLHGAGIIPAEAAGQIRLVQSLRRERPRALICFCALMQPATLHELKQYQESGGVLVTYDHPVALDCDQVLFDREENTYVATKYLLERGHRQITFCGHGDIHASNPRVAGFRRALSEFGLECGSDSLFNGGNYEEGGARLAEWYLSLPVKRRPTGVCIVNDTSAAAFINQVQRAGVRVPRDVSVVGHDDMPVARYCSVPLTTVSHPVREIAYSVLDLVMTRVDGSYSGSGRKVVVRGELIGRESVCAGPASQ